MLGWRALAHNGDPFPLMSLFSGPTGALSFELTGGVA